MKTSPNIPGIFYVVPIVLTVLYFGFSVGSVIYEAGYAEIFGQTACTVPIDHSFPMDTSFLEKMNDSGGKALIFLGVCLSISLSGYLLFAFSKALICKYEWVQNIDSLKYSLAIGVTFGVIFSIVHFLNSLNELYC